MVFWKIYKRYKEEYGFNLNRDIFIDDIRIRAIGRTKFDKNKSIFVNMRKDESCLKPINVFNLSFFKINNSYKLFLFIT